MRVDSTPAPLPMSPGARRRRIARSIVVTVPGTLALLAAGLWWLPAPADVALPERRALLALQWLLVALLPYVAVCLHIAAARFLEGAHDPLAGADSARLRIHGRVMQNTLEQFVWFAVALLALAPLLPPAQMGVVPVACIAFALARLLYWWGYFRTGTLGRAPAVQVTFTLNVAVLAAALLHFVRGMV